MTIKTYQQLIDEFGGSDPFDHNQNIVDTVQNGAEGLGHILISDTVYNEGNKLSVSPGNTKFTFTTPTIDTTYTSPAITGQGDVFSDSRITPKQVGASGTMRIDFKASSATNNNYFDIKLNIGTDGSPIYIFPRTASFVKGANTTNSYNPSWAFYCLDTWVANGAALIFDPSATIQLWDVAIVINYTTYPSA